MKMGDYCWDGTRGDEALPKNECVTCLQARIKGLEAVAEAATVVSEVFWTQRGAFNPLRDALRAAGYLNQEK